MTTSIFSTSWIDIVFHGRNQHYGAYELRQITERNTLFAIFLSITVLSVCVNVVLLKGKPNGSSNVAFIDSKDDTLEVTLTNVELPPPPQDEPELVPPPPPPVLQRPTLEMTVPVIVADATEGIDDVPTQDSFGESEAGLTTQAGDTGTFVIDPPPPIDPPAPEFVLIAEVMPRFPGGEEELLKFLGKNTRYPDAAKDVDIEGTVYIEFVVDVDGKLTNIRVAKGPHKWLNDEGLRVVKSMPDWSPGMQNGKPVRVKYVVPIRFELS